MKKTVLFLLLASTWALAQSDRDVIRMAVPDTPGRLELNLGHVPITYVLRPDGKEVQLQTSQAANGVIVSAFLQRVDFVPSPAECRKQWWTPTPQVAEGQRINVKLTESAPFARVDYDVPEFRGQRVDQHSVHVYLGGGQVCAEVHLSRVQYTPADEALFDAVLATVKLDPAAPALASSLEAFQKGSRFYLDQNWSMAATFYQRALDLEKQNRILPDAYFKVLIDNLGIAYGLSDNLPKAKATFDYGLSQDPTYPLFHYNLACYYGEQGNMNAAIGELRLAYKYKANLIPGENEMPDPLQDDSFRSFASDPTFRSAVAAMQKGRQ